MKLLVIILLYTIISYHVIALRREDIHHHNNANSLTNNLADDHDLWMDMLLNTLYQRRNINNPSYVDVIINPFSPILICDYHFMVNDLPSTMTLKINPITVETLNILQPFDILCCQTDAFLEFVKQIIPKLSTPIILFTSQWNISPLILRSAVTDFIRNHSMIAHWVAQNPIYESDTTYSGFPYGIYEGALGAYANALLQFNTSCPKISTLQMSYLSPTHSSRAQLPVVLTKKDPFDVYYSKLASSKYTISPMGDRPDCYRHWEAIGLGLFRY